MQLIYILLSSVFSLSQGNVSYPPITFQVDDSGIPYPTSFTLYAGTYQIEGYGAKGADSAYFKGGPGSYFCGNLTLEEQMTLQFCPGQAGKYDGNQYPVYSYGYIEGYDYAFSEGGMSSFSLEFEEISWFIGNGGSSGQTIRADIRGAGGGAASFIADENDEPILFVAGGSGASSSCPGAPGGLPDMMYGVELTEYESESGCYLTKDQITSEYIETCDCNGGDDSSTFPSVISGGGGGRCGGELGIEDLGSVSKGGTSWAESIFQNPTFLYGFDAESEKGYAGDGKFIITQYFDCPSNCKQCHGENEVIGENIYINIFCDNCENGYLLDSSSSCVSNCGLGQYGYQGKCYQCPSGCSECTSDILCLRCADTYYIYQNGCYSNCSDLGNFVIDDDEKTCKECVVSNCKQCQSSSYDKCEYCDDGYYLDKFQCQPDPTKSFVFSKSEQFSASSLFSQSQQFTTSSLFSQSQQFTTSSLFSQSQQFTTSSLFSQSNSFEQSSAFSKSDDFSKSSLFTVSEKFSKSIEFISSSKFSKSMSFSYSMVFTESYSNSFTGDTTPKPEIPQKPPTEADPTQDKSIDPTKNSPIETDRDATTSQVFTQIFVPTSDIDNKTGTKSNKNIWWIIVVICAIVIIVTSVIILIILFIKKKNKEDDDQLSQEASIVNNDTMFTNSQIPDFDVKTSFDVMSEDPFIIEPNESLE